MTTSSASSRGRTFRSDLPARLDRLPWSPWHVRILVGLGTVWILDGLEVTLVGALSDRLTEEGSGISLTAGDIGVAAAVYVAGACLGALFFGVLTERHGRKKLFMITLLVYLGATAMTATATEAWMFFLWRFLAGAGIGGEYSAINSAIDELMPARLRGRIDLLVNGSYWIGGAAGLALTLVLLDEGILPASLGWRLAFGAGALLGLVVLLVRRHVPESPRWLSLHGGHEEAERIVSDVERTVEREEGALPEVDRSRSLEITERPPVRISEVVRAVFGTYRKRSVLGLSLFIGQAFLYNAVYFTQGLVLGTFFDVDSARTGLYIIPLALGSFLGPLLLGRFFDTVGRRKMITMSYVGSGVLLVGTALLFQSGSLSAWGLTACWTVVFFLASAGASSAYLTVSEIFPMETRAMAIAFYFAVGTGIGGIIGPVLFGRLVETEQVSMVALGYYLGAALMIGAGIVEAVIGVDAENKALEDVADPLGASSTSP